MAISVVGVAESDTFWKDTRRILHSDSDFDILGRVARTGLQSEWTPVKVVDTCKRVVPSAADGVLEAVDSMRNIGRQEAINLGPGAILCFAGVGEFHQELSSHHNVATPGPSEPTMATLATVNGNLKEMLTALTQIADDFYVQNSDIERDADAVAALRQNAWRKAHSLAASPAELPGLAELETESSYPAVELEFIAMYW